MQDMLNVIDRHFQSSAHSTGLPGMSAAVREALAATPRDRFVPAAEKAAAFTDHALPIGHYQTISQPFIVALMTELLQPEAGDRVLEIGTGSGYQAAVLARLVAHVYTVEVVEPLARKAEDCLRGMGLDNVTVVAANGAWVRLRDVAEVKLGPSNDRTSFRRNGEEMVGLGIQRRARANTLEVVTAVRARAEKINASLPPDLGLYPSYDSSVYIDAAIDEVWKTLLIAAGIVVLVIFLFLGSARATLVPAVTVPVSLVGTLFVLYLLGFSLNLLTLLALILAIGLVVDDKEAVLEGASPGEALADEASRALAEEIEPIDDKRTMVSLLASYEPPLGRIGAVVDRVAMHRVAEAALARFFEGLLAELKASARAASA